jgi:hypothetical protein
MLLLLILNPVSADIYNVVGKNGAYELQTTDGTAVVPQYTNTNCGWFGWFPSNINSIKDHYYSATRVGIDYLGFDLSINGLDIVGNVPLGHIIRGNYVYFSDVINLSDVIVQTRSGSVSSNNFVLGYIDIGSFASTCNDLSPTLGHVTVTQMPPIEGAVTVTSLPPITGAVSITTMPTITDMNIITMPDISGTVSISSQPAITGSVAVTTIPNINIDSMPQVSGTVAISTMPSIEISVLPPVSGTISIEPPANPTAPPIGVYRVATTANGFVINGSSCQIAQAEEYVVYIVNAFYPLIIEVDNIEYTAFKNTLYNKQNQEMINNVGIIKTPLGVDICVRSIDNNQYVPGKVMLFLRSTSSSGKQH